MQATMSIGFGFPSEEAICYRKGEESLVWTNAKYYVQGEHSFKGSDRGGRGGCTGADISKAFTTFMVSEQRHRLR